MKKYPDQRVFYFKRTRSIIGDRRMGFLYAERGGGPVLKTETAWHKISGVYLNTKWGFASMQFRRRGL